MNLENLLTEAKGRMTGLFKEKFGSLLPEFLFEADALGFSVKDSKITLFDTENNKPGYTLDTEYFLGYFRAEPNKDGAVFASFSIADSDYLLSFSVL
jgi:hypothetical protein